MKKILPVIATLFLFMPAFAQSEKDVISASEITWFGLDFSKAQFVGSFNQFAEAGGNSGSEIKNKYFGQWNDVVVNERDKYDMKKSYNKTSVNYNLDIVTKRNASVDADKLITLNAEADHIKKEDLAKIASAYKTDKKGIGLVYVIDTFSKADEKGIIWVVFFDLATRKVLIAEKFTGKPGGFGLRNFWVKPVHDVMMKSSADAYKNSWSK